MNEKLETLKTRTKAAAVKVKTHVVDHKEAYIAGGAAALASGIVVYVVMKTRQSSPEAVVTTDSNKIEFKWKSPTSNNVTVNLIPRGELGNPVRCLETGEIFESQRFAAMEKGISPGNMTKHLNGEREHLGGLHFERLPWNES